ncbi:MAG: aspartate aminotransferase family protein [Alphaproteobacteria bacterium]|nr:aspartate aminotransferase family protein [Alphaproteobacteria bacterium]
MTHIIHRQPSADYPVVAKGDGVYLIDSTGKRYLDACGGAAVSCLGHSDDDIRKAIASQVNKIAYAHSSFFTNEPMEKLADYLVEKSPTGLDWVYFVSGGSEAVETALKIARQYFVESGQPKRSKIISRRQSYHGNTLGTLAAGGNALRQEHFKPLLINVEHIAPCYAYRYQKEDETEEEYGLRAANELDVAIRKLGSENVAAFIAEPVVGSTIGAAPAVKGYLKRIREICDYHGVLLIFDEVMCGMGRTGTLFACEQDGVAPDILTIAKALGAGYQPIGATLVSDKIYSQILNGSGFFQHGHTYVGHATACAAALAVQYKIRDNNILENVQKMGALLKEKLVERFGNHPNVGNIRGRGLFIGLEFVADKKTKKPFDPSLKLNKLIKKEAFERGLMCYCMGGTIDGKNGDHLLLAPPYIINEKHVFEIVDKLDEVISAVIKKA